jgi:predicted nucleic acid-binding protein
VQFLLDTCVLAELTRPKPEASVIKALQDLSDADSFISVVSIGEIQKGISLRGDGRRKMELAAWLEALETQYENQILTVDRETARIWGTITAEAQKAGRTIPAADGLIASTALHRGLTVMTRNASDFEVTGVPILNPWSLPPE